MSDSASTQNQYASVSGLPQQATRTPNVLLTTAVAYTVSSAQSGSLFQLPSVGATITLPSPANSKGCTYTFRMIANNGTTAWTIASTAGNVYGSAVQGATALTPYPLAAGSTNCIFGTGCLVGDTIILSSDGTYYYVTGYSRYNTASTNGISFS